MYEYFLTGLIVGDETISLRCVEPLNGTLIQSTASYIDKYLYFSWNKKITYFCESWNALHDLQKYVNQKLISKYEFSLTPNKVSVKQFQKEDKNGYCLEVGTFWTESAVR